MPTRLADSSPVAVHPIAPAIDPVASLIAVTPTTGLDRVVVIGHGTLPLMLAFMHRGCRAAAELRASAVSPDAQPADLAWITGVVERSDCDNALRAALRGIGHHGRLAIDATAMAVRRGLNAVLRWLRRNGLAIDGTHTVGNRIVILAHG